MIHKGYFVVDKVLLNVGIKINVFKNTILVQLTITIFFYPIDKTLREKECYYIVAIITFFV